MGAYSTPYEYVIHLRDKASGTMKRVGAYSSSTYEKMIRKQEALDRSTSNYGNTLKRVFSGYLGAMALRNITNTSANMQSMANSIDFISGSTIEASRNNQFLTKTVDDLGLSYEASAEGFKTFTGSFKGTKMTMEQQRNMFYQVNTAVTSLGLSSERAKLVLLAMGQMASKGVVSMEELRRQLGDSIPGAFGIAARAMGVTTKELNKLVESGKLMSEDFLPRFSAQIEKEFTGGLDKASQSMRANMNRIANTWLRMKLVGGQVIEPLLQEMTPLAMKWGEWAQNVQISSDEVLKWAKLGLKTIKVIAAYKTSVFLATNGLKLFTKAQMFSARSSLVFRRNLRLASMQTGIFNKGLTFASASWKGLSMAMKTNAIGLAITGLGFIAEKLIRARQEANQAKEAHKGYNEELERSFEIANKEKMNKFLIESGLMEKVDIGGLGNRWGRAFEINVIKGDGTGLEQAIKATQTLEGLQSLQDIINKQLVSSERNLANIGSLAKQAGMDGNDIYKDTVRGQLLKSISAYKAALASINKEVAKYGDGKGSINLNELNETTTNITSGGARPTNITIQFNNVVETMEILAKNLDEGVEEIKDKVAEALLQVLNSANDVAYGN